MVNAVHNITETLKVENFGPIKRAEVEFGDLTILTGPQASGKSLFAELFKLIKDKPHVISTLQKYNYILGESSSLPLSEYYFGEGMSGLIKKDTKIFDNSNHLAEELDKVVISDNPTSTESVFFVPAQRILSISDGRPKNFMEFDLSTPYPLRHFSETLRVFLQSGLGNPEVIFPMNLRLNNSVRNSISDTIFHDGQVIIDSSESQRKMKLRVDGMKLPFMTWSAGQKEFMPLLLAFYCLTGPQNPVINKTGYDWVIIEEPEMGLHPKAIESVIIQIIELMRLGYRVILSTHSSVFLDFAWAVASVKNCCSMNFTTIMCKLFGVSHDKADASIFEGLESKKIKAYYFSGNKHDGITSTDISSLDVMSDDEIHDICKIN